MIDDTICSTFPIKSIPTLPLIYFTAGLKRRQQSSASASISTRIQSTSQLASNAATNQAHLHQSTPASQSRHLQLRPQNLITHLDGTQKFTHSWVGRAQRSRTTNHSCDIRWQQSARGTDGSNQHADGANHFCI